MHPILSRQNEPYLLQLLKASTVAYTRSKAWEIFITYFLIFLAIAYPATYVFLKNDKVKFTLFGCSFLLTLLIQIFMDKFRGNTSKGAIYKEEFDVEIFGLPWKSTLTKPDASEVNRLANSYKGPSITDWYSTKLSADLDRVTAVAILQHLNTNWDIVLRKSYTKLLVFFLMAYSLALLVIVLIRRVDFLTVFLMLFSVLSFYTHFISMIRSHAGVIRKRKHIAGLIDEMLRHKKQLTLVQLRDIQDEIFITRQEATKVPNFFFRWYRNKMNREADRYIEEMNKLYSHE